MRPRVRSRSVASLAVCVVALHVGEAAALGINLNCTIQPNTVSLAFGTYNPVSGLPTMANAMITVSCTETLTLLSDSIPFTLTLSPGSSGNVANRTMIGSTTNLPYNVYKDASYTTVWDNINGVTGTVTIQGTIGLGASGSTTVPGYGRIPASQPVKAGSYTDSLTITVTF